MIRYLLVAMVTAVVLLCDCGRHGLRGTQLGAAQPHRAAW
jgi:hypothetical protein